MNKALLGIIISVALGFSQIGMAQAQTKPHVLVLATGGTIAQTTSKSSSLKGEELIEAIPQLEDIADITTEQIVQVSSPDITESNWIDLGKRINEALSTDEVQGIVVTHGTDTMEETAFFLDLVVKSDKPVVMVGSMRESQALSADGSANLFNAVTTAASEAAYGKGVLVILNDRIQAARDVTKTNTFTLDALSSGDLGALGYIQAEQIYFYRAPVRKHTLRSEFEVPSGTLPPVVILESYVGVTPDLIDAAVAAGVKGIVWAGTGNGSVPKAVQPAAQAAAEKGVVFVRSTRVNGGRVERNGEHNDDEMGFVTSDTLNPQKARILLMLALSKTSSATEIQEFFDAY